MPNIRYTVLALAVVLFFQSPAAAARLFLSTNPTLLPSDVGGVPRVSLESGAERDLFVWLLPDPDQDYAGVAYSLATDRPGVVTAVSNILDNPTNLNNNLPRWAFVNHSVINTTRDPDGPSGPLPTESLLVDNTRAAVVVPGTNRGIGSLAQHENDPLRDASGSFRLGAIRIRWQDGLDPVGLYFRQGFNAFVIRNGAGTTITNTVPLFFGDTASSPTNAGSTGRNRGDQMLLELADAIIYPSHTPPGEILDRLDDGANQGPRVIVPAPGPGESRFREVPFDNVPEGQVTFQGYANSQITYFLDLEMTGEPLDAILARIAQEEADESLLSVEALPGLNDLGTGVDYDFAITYQSAPGNDQILDFDFAPVGATVRHIAIPEPGTGGLAVLVLGLAWAAARRKRRRAAGGGGGVEKNGRSA